MADRVRNDLRLIAHADWSMHPTKRWIAVATRQPDLLIERLECVGDPRGLLEHLSAAAAPGTALVGFDFPIGIPVAYARRAQLSSFRALLQCVSACRNWSKFYQPARSPQEISTQRPFYPAVPGGTAQAHLCAGLGVSHISDLLRECERRTAARNAACPVFWTLGAKQVGRAAITGWRDVIGPALTAHEPMVALWPFDGLLDDLVGARRCVVVETYPAETYGHVGIARAGHGWSKRRQADRQREAAKLFSWLVKRNIKLTAGIEASVRAGFGSEAHGEDAFDAFVGLLGMLAVILGERSAQTPDTKSVRQIEGWIFGQA